MSKKFFKVLLSDPAYDIRSEAKKHGSLYQLFIDQSNPREALIQYKAPKDADKARASFASNTNIVAVMPMDEWNVKPPKKQAMKVENAKPLEKVTPKQQNPQYAPAQLGMPPPYLSMNPCAHCCKNGAQFQCYVCGTLYCGEECQIANWPGHIQKCMPRLVRATYVLVSGGPAYGLPQPSFIPGNGPGLPVPPVFNRPPPECHGFNGNMNVPQQQGKSGSQTSNSASSVRSNLLKNISAKSQKLQAKEVVKSNGLQNDDSVANEVGGPTPPIQNVKYIVPAKPKPGVSNMFKLMQLKNCLKSAAQRKFDYGPFPAEGDNVKISYVTDKALFVYREGQEKNGQPNNYMSFIKRSVTCARNATKCLPKAPTVGDIVFAPFEGDSYRAVVKSVTGENVGVFFPDFGNEQTLPWNVLKDIPDLEVKYGTCHTHPVSIANVPSFSSKVRSFLISLQEVDVFELTKVEGVGESAGRTVDMRHIQELYLLSKKIQDMDADDSSSVGKKVDVPTASDAPDAYVPVTAQDFEEQDMPCNQEVELVIVETSELDKTNQLSVMLKSDTDQFSKTLLECNQFGKMNDKPYTPEKEDEACLCPFEEIWCRALPVELDSQLGKQYYLLDLGIITTLDETLQCRRYPAALSRKLFVSECVVDNPNDLKLDVAHNEHSNDSLRGMHIKAYVYMHQDEDGNETLHIKDISIISK